MDIVQKTYFYGKLLFWFLYIITLLGVWDKAPEYLNAVDETFKVVIAFILIYFFNPLVKTECTGFHRKVVFTSAIMLLFSSSLKSILQNVPILKRIIV
jgi:hypothetical protein